MKKRFFLLLAIAALGVLALLFMQCASSSKPESAAEKTMEDKEIQVVKKLCALTFDDGPDSRLTARVLDKLEAHNVVASFFLVGQRIDGSAGLVLERALKLGCEFENHSWAYDSMDKMTAEQIQESIAKTTAAIEKFTGTTPHFFRPPNLAKSALMFEVINLPFAEGIAGFDWAGTGTTAEQRAQNVLNNIQDGAIILLHDVQPEPHPTPEALDILIPELKKQGYEFVTLNQLFKLKGITPDPKQKKAWVIVK